MYVGYDDSARVLSYLLGYKLYDTFEGIAASGPDKEKIMGVLSTHHVNYVISEYGSITEFRTFEDNRFNTYMKLASEIKPSHPEFPTIKERPSKEVQPVPQVQQPIPIQTPEWFVIGLKVVHSAFGNGEITEINNNVFTVEFESEDKKRFVFPSAFDNGFIKKLEFSNS